jgi:signal transduction histidine kinase
VFEKFFRVPGQSRGTGTGLGLAIVNEIVAAHGGTIACESRPGAGTAFHIRLPQSAEGRESGYVFGELEAPRAH